MCSASSSFSSSLSPRELADRLAPHGLSIHHRNDEQGVPIKGRKGSFLITTCEESLYLRELSDQVEKVRKRLHRITKDSNRYAERGELLESIDVLQGRKAQALESLRELFAERLNKAVRITDLIREDFFSSESHRPPAVSERVVTDRMEWRRTGELNEATASGSPPEPQRPESLEKSAEPLPPEEASGKSCSIQ